MVGEVVLIVRPTSSIVSAVASLTAGMLLLTKREAPSTIKVVEVAGPIFVVEYW